MLIDAFTTRELAAMKPHQQRAILHITIGEADDEMLTAIRGIVRSQLAREVLAREAADE